MPTDLDIYRSAAVLIEHHGENAKLEAAKHADSWLAERNTAAQAFWLSVASAIDTLQHAKRLSDEPPN